jgi:hypothetical protein
MARCMGKSGLSMTVLLPVVFKLPSASRKVPKTRGAPDDTAHRHESLRVDDKKIKQIGAFTLSVSGLGKCRPFWRSSRDSAFLTRLRAAASAPCLRLVP